MYEKLANAQILHYMYAKKLSENFFFLFFVGWRGSKCPHPRFLLIWILCATTIRPLLSLTLRFVPTRTKSWRHHCPHITPHSAHTLLIWAADQPGYKKNIHTTCVLVIFFPEVNNAALEYSLRSQSNVSRRHLQSSNLEPINSPLMSTLIAVSWSLPPQGLTAHTGIRPMPSGLVIVSRPGWKRTGEFYEPVRCWSPVIF